MKIEYKPSFLKSIKSLPKPDKEEIVSLCEDLIDILEKSKESYKGIGLKRLQKNFWEIRKGIKQRVIFRWQQDYLEFVLVGTHDSIKKFLKQNV